MVLDENFTKMSVSTQTEAENDRLYQSINVMLVTDCRVTACLPSFWSVTSTEHNSTRAIFHARYRVISLANSIYSRTASQSSGNVPVKLTVLLVDTVLFLQT